MYVCMCVCLKLVQNCMSFLFLSTIQQLSYTLKTFSHKGVKLAYTCSIYKAEVPVCGLCVHVCVSL